MTISLINGYKMQHGIKLETFFIQHVTLEYSVHDATLQI